MEVYVELIKSGMFYKGPLHNCTDCKNRLWLMDNDQYCKVEKKSGKWTNVDKIDGTCKCIFTDKLVMEKWHCTDDFTLNCDNYECDDQEKLKFERI